jgi:threonylcarbamoyladenosine tRNA methylthiotransferase MtaB
MLKFYYYFEQNIDYTEKLVMKLAMNTERTVAFHTLGCKVNHYESEALAQLFEKKGYRVVEFDEKADVYVINTCTVTGMSARKSRQMARKAKKTNKDGIVAVIGCYSQISPEEVSSIEGVDIVLGTQAKNRLPEYIEELLKTGKARINVADFPSNKEYEEFGVSTFRDRSRAYVKIQDGCRQFCTYCIIPYARGPVRSRKPESILEEVRKLVREGFKEIVLTGIHVASYGRDLNGIGLLEIIKLVHETEGVMRLRLSSLEPRLLSDDFISEAASLPRLCPHFHLSLQSGCDDTLKRMNRKYTAEEYESIVRKLVENIPGVAITTDVMVGFPGETDREFEQSISFIKKLPLAGIHVFKYSIREGTPAALFEGQVPPEIKDERSKRLIALAHRKQLEFYKKFIGRTMEVLFEGPASDCPGFLEGRTPNYIRVLAEGNNDIIGEIRDVILEKAEKNRMFGNIV